MDPQELLQRIQAGDTESEEVLMALLEIAPEAYETMGESYSTGMPDIDMLTQYLEATQPEEVAAEPKFNWKDYLDKFAQHGGMPRGRPWDPANRRIQAGINRMQ